MTNTMSVALCERNPAPAFTLNTHMQLGSALPDSCRPGSGADRSDARRSLSFCILLVRFQTVIRRSRPPVSLHTPLDAAPVCGSAGTRTHFESASNCTAPRTETHPGCSRLQRQNRLGVDSRRSAALARAVARPGRSETDSWRAGRGGRPSLGSGLQSLPDPPGGRF